jgi:hypothetical protein
VSLIKSEVTKLEVVATPTAFKIDAITEVTVIP